MNRKFTIPKTPKPIERVPDVGTDVAWSCGEKIHISTLTNIKIGQSTAVRVAIQKGCVDQSLHHLPLIMYLSLSPVSSAQIHHPHLKALIRCALYPIWKSALIVENAKACIIQNFYLTLSSHLLKNAKRLPFSCTLGKNLTKKYRILTTQRESYTTETVQGAWDVKIAYLEQNSHLVQSLIVANDTKHNFLGVPIENRSNQGQAKITAKLSAVLKNVKK